MTTEHNPMFATGRAGLRPVRRAAVVDARHVLHHQRRVIAHPRERVEPERALRSRREGPHPRDLDRVLQRPSFHVGRDGVDAKVEKVGEHPEHRCPHHLQREVQQHERQLVHGSAEADDLAHDGGLVVERVVEDLLHADLGDPRADPTHEYRENVERPPGIDTGDEHRCAPRDTRWLHHVE